MTTFFTSDLHLGHERIIELAGRPFKDADHMNNEIISRWNTVVTPEDTVFVLGDVALGKIASSLPRVGNLNGYKILIEGNHDRPFMDRHKPEKRARWIEEYSKYFDEIHEDGAYTFGATTANPVRAFLSHFPYDGDSHGADRHSDSRLPDQGVPLIHGHTHHSGNPVSFSAGKGTLQIHVGQDEWSFAPVSEFAIHMLLLRERKL